MYLSELSSRLNQIYERSTLVRYAENQSTKARTTMIYLTMVSVIAIVYTTVNATKQNSCANKEIQKEVIPMAKRHKSYSSKRTGRRAGLFIGGVAYGLIRGIFFKNKY